MAHDRAEKIGNSSSHDAIHLIRNLRELRLAPEIVARGDSSRCDAKEPFPLILRDFLAIGA